MRSCLFLLLAVTLAGCPGSSANNNVGTSYNDAGCQFGCDKCPDNTFCVSAPYAPTCLKVCGSDSDCAEGQQCALINAPPLNALGCVAPDRPATCSAINCDIQPKCRGPKTLLKPLDYLDQVCGWEVVPCVNGCDATTAQCK